MIETPSGWIHEEDLTRAEVLDRRDSFELRQACVAYLKSHHTLTRPKSIGAASDRNVQKALVQASIRRLVGIRARDSALHSLLSQREGVIEEQSKTIDRLLAYIPARAAPLSDQRLQEIAGYVSDFLTKRDLSANVHCGRRNGTGYACMPSPHRHARQSRHPYHLTDRRRTLRPPGGDSGT